MLTGKASDIKKTKVAEKDVSGVTMRVLIGEKQGAPNFVMRLFELAEKGHTARHTHPWEHEVYVVEGVGVVRQGGKEHRIRAGSFVFVKPNEDHQFLNRGKGQLKFVCIVPIV